MEKQKKLSTNNNKKFNKNSELYINILSRFHSRHNSHFCHLVKVFRKKKYNFTKIDSLKTESKTLTTLLSLVFFFLFHFFVKQFCNFSLFYCFVFLFLSTNICSFCFLIDFFTSLFISFEPLQCSVFLKVTFIT